VKRYPCLPTGNGFEVTRNADDDQNIGSSLNTAENFGTIPGIIPQSAGLATVPVQELLMAWYQCGYATGRYQALMELEAEQAVQKPQTFQPEQEND
jgi:hypothetical protein